ncbi:hypothetical protein CF319_g2163 [Tilletia indica]|nr:hypothetical protein CF319_g2163 [Tilletia indica]
MEDYAVDRVCALVAKETSILTKNAYLSGPDAHNITGEDLASFDPSHACSIMATFAPVSTRILHSMAGETALFTPPPQRSSHPPPKKKQKRNPGYDIIDDALSSSDDDTHIAEHENYPKVPGIWSRGGERSKSNLAFTAFFILLFACSRRCNRFQQCLGVVLFAARVPKRPMELLSRAGICVSTQTVAQGIVSLANDSMRVSRELIHRPDTVISLSIDNLNWLSKIRDKTTTVRNSMMAAVAGNFYVVEGSIRYTESTPTCSAELFEAIFGGDLTMPTFSARPINPLRQDGKPIAMDKKLLDEAIRSAERDTALDTSDYVLSAIDQRHLIEATVSHAIRQWIDLHPECSDLADKLSKPPQILPFEPKKTRVLPLPVYDEDEGSIAGNIRVLDKVCDDFGLDEAWLADHIVPAVGDALTASLQRKAVDRRINDRSSTPERHRIKYLKPWAAFFHFHYAYQKFLIDTHSGTATIMDLLSIRRVASKAGFKNLTTGNVDFHDADAFFHTYFAAISEVIISDALRQAGHGRQADELIPNEDGDVTLVDEVEDAVLAEVEEEDGDITLVEDTQEALVEETQSQFDFDFEESAQHPDETQLVDESQSPHPDETQPNALSTQPPTQVEDAIQQQHQHESAESSIPREQTQAIPDGGVGDGFRWENEFEGLKWEDLQAAATTAVRSVMKGSVSDICKGEEPRKDDLIYGHAVSLFRDLAVYIEIRHATKHGDPGRVFAMVRQALPRFQACGAHRYVSECLEMLTDLRYDLPPALKQVMMGATLVNHKGRPDSFVAADLDIEHLVNDLKNVFPVQSKSGGCDSQRRIGEILTTLRASKAQFFQAYSIASLGGSHTTRDRTLTKLVIATELQQYRTFKKQSKGRVSPVFQHYGWGKRKARTAKTKHLATDHVAAGTDILLGTSSKVGSIQAFWDRRRKGIIEEGGIGDEEHQASVIFDAEKDMGGFAELGADV